MREGASHDGEVFHLPLRLVIVIIVGGGSFSGHATWLGDAEKRKLPLRPDGLGGVLVSERVVFEVVLCRVEMLAA